MAHGPARPRLFEVDPAPVRQVTFLISDVECFTQLTERLGDRAALSLMCRYYTMVRQSVVEYQGEEVELHGDGFVSVFECPVQAVRCAVAMQRTLARSQHELPLRVRMGLHSGLALLHEEIYFGRALIVACRIAAFARARQILVSEPVCEQVERQADLRRGGAFEVWLKGFREPHRVFEVAWEETAARKGGARRTAPGVRAPVGSGATALPEAPA
jgi:class 3 adenylate cyclase